MPLRWRQHPLPKTHFSPVDATSHPITTMATHLVRLFVELRSSDERISQTASLKFTANGIPYQTKCHQNLFWSLLWPRYSTLETPPTPFHIVCVDSNEGTFTPRVRSISVHCLQGLRSVRGPTISFAWYAIYTRYQSFPPLHVIANVLTAFTKDDPH